MRDLTRVRPRASAVTRLAAVPLLVSLALAVTGCGHPFVPGGALRTRAPAPAGPAGTGAVPPAGSAAAPAPSAGSTPTPGGGQPAAPPSGPPVLGVDLYASADYPLALVRRDGARDLAYLRNSVGATGVGLVWDLTSPGLASDAVLNDTPATLSPAGVAALTQQARADGLTVQYRPLVRVGPRWSWEGHLQPANDAAWFGSLFQAELPYLRTARRLGVSSFVVATELYDLNASPGWPAFLARVRSVFPGEVSVAQYQTDYYTQRLLPVSAYGVDPYPALTLPDSASVGQVTAAWERVFAPVPAAVLARTTMDEVGFAGRSGAYSQPQNWRLSTTPNRAMQARWFTAACRTAARYHLRGVYFYEANLTQDPASPSAFPAFFEGTSAAAAISGCRRVLGLTAH